MHRKVLRGFTQGSVLIAALLIPVFDIIRFDIVARELYLFGQVWSFAPQWDFMSGAVGNPANFLFKGVFPLIAIFLSLPVLGAVLGRFFCGWFCPVGTIYEAGNFFKKKLAVFKRCRIGWQYGNEKADWKDIFFGFITALFIAGSLLVMGAFFSGLFIAPVEIWRQVSSHECSPFFIIVALGMMALIVAVYFARRSFCSYICLFGITMMIPFVVSPLSLRIRFDMERKGAICKNCGRCERACIMGIKPRAQKNKINPKCINCGECITACEQEFDGRDGLLYYGFGKRKKHTENTSKGVGYNEVSA